ILHALGLEDQVLSVQVDRSAPAREYPELERDALAASGVTLIFTSETSAGGGFPRWLLRKNVALMRPRPSIYALEPHTLGDILSDIKTVGDATGRQNQARALIEALRARIDSVTVRSARALAERPPCRVACLLSPDPPTAAGWWLADLIGLAGGWDVLGGACRAPRMVTWAEVEAAHPDLVVYVSPSGQVQPITPGMPFPEVAARPGAGYRFLPQPGPGAVDLLEQLAALIQ
ncbi:MAG: hypothetical protein AB7P40_31425, partial [Chloroflexota bacterium]